MTSVRQGEDRGSKRVVRFTTLFRGVLVVYDANNDDVHAVLYLLHVGGGQNRTLHLLAVPAGNRTSVLANAETYPTRYRARFSNVHRLLFGGLRDWCPCHLTKEDIRVGATARWGKDTGEDTLSLRRTIYSDRTRAAVDVKGKFLGTYS
jgi:hypothetical protein